VSPEEFYRYWLEEHGPKVRSVAKALNAVKYIQSHTVLPERNQALQESRGLEPPYDGITEVWYPSPGEPREEVSAEERQAAAKLLFDDESRFIDFSRSRVFMTEEHVIFDYTEGTNA
ncbi:MAG: EthD domain-containing protein, partial [Dehalococcoidia bacterium]|nr:EthD domain-containing protein [Dehalococcoidia bacterium]